MLHVENLATVVLYNGEALIVLMQLGFDLSECAAVSIFYSESETVVLHNTAASSQWKGDPMHALCFHTANESCMQIRGISITACQAYNSNSWLTTGAFVWVRWVLYANSGMCDVVVTSYTFETGNIQLQEPKLKIFAWKCPILHRNMKIASVQTYLYNISGC